MQNFGKDIAEHYGITNLSVECDFVVQRNEHIDELIQVTWDMSEESTKEREISGILEASKVTKCDNLTIITTEEESILEINGKKINIIPAWKWALGK